MTFELTKCKRFLGLPLYQKWRALHALKRVYLGGLYKESVTFEDYGEATRQCHLLGIPLFGRKLDAQAMTWHVGNGLPVKKLDIAQTLRTELDGIFADMPVKAVDGKRHVFVFWANSGEIAILLMFFWKQLLERFQIREPDEVVVLCTKNYHKEMLRFYFPQIRALVAKPKILRYVLGDMSAGDWEVHMCFPGKYFAQFEASAADTPINYVDWMSQWFALPLGLPQKPDSQQLAAARASALPKLSALQRRALEEGRLVVLALDSFSSTPLDDETKRNIKDELLGWDLVLYNNTSDPNDGHFMTYPELFAIAQSAHSVVALRSGLVDFLANSQAPITTYYTAFPDRGFNTPPKSALAVFNLFAMKQHFQNATNEIIVA